MINDHNYKHHGILEIVFISTSVITRIDDARVSFIRSFVRFAQHPANRTEPRALIFTPCRSYSVVLLTLRNDRHLILQGMP